MRLATTSKYRSTRRRTTSGSALATRPVESTRSAKRTVATLRSTMVQSYGPGLLPAVRREDEPVAVGIDERDRAFARPIRIRRSLRLVAGRLDRRGAIRHRSGRTEIEDELILRRR